MVRYLRLLLAAIVISVGSALTSALAIAGSSPIGIWSTKDNESHVQIRDCGGKLCGKIIWLKEPLDDDGTEKRDKNNPDKAERERKIVGLPLLAGFVRSAEASDKWENGRIYNPEDGETYRCTMTLESADTLRVRGYVGMPLFGKTQVWKRVK